LKTNDTLQVIDLSENGATDEEAKLLSENLMKNQSLRVLDFCNFEKLITN